MALGTGLDDILWEALSTLLTQMQMAHAGGMCGSWAEDPLSLWLIPQLVHAYATHNVLTFLFPPKVHALKWGHELPDRV